MGGSGLNLVVNLDEGSSWEGVDELVLLLGLDGGGFVMLVVLLVMALVLRINEGLDGVVDHVLDLTLRHGTASFGGESFLDG